MEGSSLSLVQPDGGRQLVIPLVREVTYRSRLIIFLDTRLLEDQLPVETQVHLVARRLLQGGTTAVSFLARIPFIPLSLKFAGDNHVYGGFLAYGACASFGYLVAFSSLEIIDEQMRPMTREERFLLESRVGPCLKKTFFISSIVLGTITQIPFAFIAYKYNEPSTINPGGVLAPIFIVLVDSWVSTYSAYMGMRSLRDRQSLTDYEKGLVHIRSQMQSFIDTNRELLALIDREEQSTFVETFNSIQALECEEDRVKQLYIHLSTRVSDKAYVPSCLTTCLNYFFFGYGGLCALTNIGALGYIAWYGMDQLANTLGLNVTVTTLYVGTALYLNTTAIPHTAVKLFNLARSIFTCSYRPTLADSLTPKLSFVSKGLGLVTTALAYGTAMQLSRDYFNEEEWLEIYMSITLTSATTCLVSMAILSITDSLLEKKVERYGTEDEKQLMIIHQKMKIFSQMLQRSPLFETASLLKILPAEVFASLTEHTAITLDNLTAYIQAQVQATERAPLIQ